jgi:transforming growth factor-beta-induced protein
MPVRSRLRRAAPLLLAFLAPLAACDNDLGVAPEDSGIMAVLTGDPDFSQLNALVQESPLAATLAAGGPYTLFAPDDVAFLYLGQDTRALLLAPENDALLDRVLRYHVVPGQYAAEDLTDGLVLETLDGTPLPVRREGETIFVGEARVTDDAIGAENGVVYPVSTVLRANLTLAERLRLTPIAADFVALLERAGLFSVLEGEEPHTVFATVDDAFDQLGGPALNLLYDPDNADVVATVANSHLVEGEVVLGELPDGAPVETREGLSLTVTRANGVFFVGGRRVLSPPVQTTTGVFYLLDRLVLDGLDLDQHLRITPALSEFARRAVRFPALDGRLSGEEPHTVFAFTDVGWRSLASGVGRALDLAPNAPLLERVLEVHVVPGRYRLADLSNGQVLQTVEGAPLTVHVLGTEVRVSTPAGGRGVVAADQEADNGVLHQLDGVLYPETDVFDTALLRGLPDYTELVRQAGLESLFRTTDPITVFGFVGPYISGYGLEAHPDLHDILLYHAAPEPLPSLFPGQTITPFVGPDWTAFLVNVAGTDVYMLDSLVTVGLIAPATNGYVYYADGDTLVVPP